MATLLNIETSTEICSTVLSQNGEILLEKVYSEGMAHAAKLPVFVQETLDFVRKNGLTLDAVAVSSGPGSYTGLRIGVSTAKGLCFGANIPLIAIDTLKIMAKSAISQHNFAPTALLLPMIDARRMEIYTECFTQNLEQKMETSAEIVDENFAKKWQKMGQKIYFFGNGAKKCVPILANENVVFVENIVPMARDMVSLSEKAFTNRQFEDVAYFEPFYLKEFMATVAKPKL